MAELKSQPQSKNQAFLVAGQLRDLWNKQPKGRRTLAILVVLGVLGYVGITSLTKHVETWVSAADGIAPDEAQQLYATLIGRGVPARFSEGKVEVQPDDLASARAIAATSLQMGGGKGLETFENSTMGETSFAEQVNYKRALQTELTRSITSISQIENARVNIAFGHHAVFKDQESPPTASIMLRLRAGQSLLANEVKGIRQLVASSIDGMKPEAVVVVDNHGNPLEAAEKSNANDGTSIETTIVDSVTKMLTKYVGKGHVQVVANIDLDTRHIEQTEDLYDKDAAAIRSQARTIDGNDPTATAAGSASGIAGVRGNLPGATPAGMSAGGSGANGKIAETTNYEVSHTQRHTENPEVSVKKIHVAVLLDQQKGKDGKPIVRSKEDMAGMLAIARTAAGIDDARGDTIEIQSTPFVPDDEVAPDPVAPKSALPFPLPVMAGAGAGALVLLIVIALVLRSVFKKKSKSTAMVKSPQIAFPTQVADLERVLDARPPSHQELPIERELPALNPGKSVQERVMDAVRGDVERAASVLTAWLNEAPPKGAK
jgi:flagellar M-ring protein FliF